MSDPTRDGPVQEDPAVDGLVLHEAAFADLGVQVLHDILKLRVDVFVVEQDCPYPEIDGLDPLPTTSHLWLADGDGRIAAYVRVLAHTDPLRIGRVVTAGWARRRGLARRLLEAAMAAHPGPAVLDAQVQAADLYRGLGFVQSGPEFLEDGIPHIPMAWTPPPA